MLNFPYALLRSALKGSGAKHTINMRAIEIMLIVCDLTLWGVIAAMTMQKNNSVIDISSRKYILNRPLFEIKIGLIFWNAK